jgi:hypothetical protein
MEKTPDWSTRALWQSYQQSRLVAKQGKVVKEENLAYNIFLSYFKGFLSCRKILRHGADSFTFPPKEGVLPIFIALKNTSPSAGSEPVNFGYNGKHANN